MPEPSDPSQPGHPNLAALPNPYDFAKPVTREDRFAGRASELTDIKYYLSLAKQTPEPMNLAIIGDRASGKTSMLNIIDIEAKKLDLVTARINLNTADAEPINFFWKLYDALVNAYCTAGHLFKPGSDEEQVYRRMIDSLDPSADSPNFPLRFPSQYARSIQGSRQISESKLQQDLEYIYAETGAPCLLLFDECNVLTQNRVTLEMLRNVFMNIPGYMITLTGTPAFFPLLDDIFSPIIRQFKKINIQPFDDFSDTVDCVCNPLRSLGLRANDLVSDRAIFDIHVTSRGRPYEIQLLCHFMFRRLQDQRATQMTVTADVMDDVLNELEANISGGAVDRPIVAAARDMGQSQLAAVGVFGRANHDNDFDAAWLMNIVAAETDRMAGKDPTVSDEFSREELLGLLEELKQLGVLDVRDDGQIIFAGDDFDRIYLRYHAERLGLSVNIDDYPLDFTLPLLLDKALQQIGLRTQIEFSRDPSLEKAVNALLSPPRGEITEIAAAAVRPVFSAIDDGELTIAGVTLTTGRTHARSWAWWPSGEGHDLEADPKFNELRHVIESNGGSMSVSSSAFYLPPETDIMEKMLASPNLKLRQRFSSFLTDAAFDEYMAGEYEAALRQAKRAARFDVVATSDLNNIAYMHMILGDIGDAKVLFGQAIDQATGSQRGDLRTAALALYNSAMVALLERRFDDAMANLTQASAKLAGGRETTFLLRCLLIPTPAGDTLKLQEMWDPELSESIDNATELLRGAVDFDRVEISRTP